MSSSAAVELPAGPPGQREVVERGDPGPQIAGLLGQRAAALQVLERLVQRAAARREHAEQVVRAAERPRVTGPLRQRERLAGELRRAVLVAAVVGDQAEVGVDLGAQRQRVRRRCRQRGAEVRNGERPVTAPVMQAAEAVLDSGERPGRARAAAVS